MTEWMMERSQRIMMLDSFKNFFYREVRKRKDKDRDILLPSGEMAWAEMEAEAMLGKINTSRGHLKKKPITMERYKEMVDQKAIGHSDYASKVCLYSVELVLNED